MLARRRSAILLFAFTLAAVVPAAAAGDWRGEGFVGYTFPEELEGDVAYGARLAWDSKRGWGFLLSYEMFETGGEGYGLDGGVDGGVDAELAHLELSWVARPGAGAFELFSGVGATDLDVESFFPGLIAGLDGTELSIHAGIGYLIDLGDVIYLRPELRARMYDAEDETIDFTASLAIGFR